MKTSSLSRSTTVHLLTVLGEGNAMAACVFLAGRRGAFEVRPLSGDYGDFCYEFQFQDEVDRDWLHLAFFEEQIPILPGWQMSIKDMTLLNLVAEDAEAALALARVYVQEHGERIEPLTVPLLLEDRWLPVQMAVAWIPAELGSAFAVANQHPTMASVLVPTRLPHS